MLELWSKKLLGGEAKLKEPVRFDYTGAVQTFVVPSGVHEITVDCVGASGGRGGANKVTYGGRVTCVLSVIPGEELYLYVGGSGATSGYNGGGAAGSSSSYTAYYRGGGASDIRTISGDLNSRLIVAGGAGASGATSGVAGGNGGGLVGADGGRNRTAYVISGGSQDSGGTCTPADWYTPGSDYAGSFGSGGKGEQVSYGAGGGGGGWYGGGGGLGLSGPSIYGGGGGSSYTNPDRCSDVVHTQGYSAATGNGWIILS